MSKKTGLVLEGGAMRGLFSAAVLDTFLENGISSADFGAVAGVSAGATFGCNFMTEQKGRALRYCLKYCYDPRFCSFTSLFLTGDMFGAKFCYRTLPEQLDPIDSAVYEGCGVPFYLVCTDVNTGKAVYHRCRNFRSHEEMDWMRAGASMPLVSRIVRCGDFSLLDGGIADSVPLKYMEHKGFARNIVILTQPETYVKQPNPMMQAARMRYRHYPNLLRAMERRHTVYNGQTAFVRQRAGEGKALVIQPPALLPVTHTSHSPDMLRAVYRIGRETALRNLEAVRGFLEK